MLRILAVLLLISAATMAGAQTPLQSQIDAVYNAQERNRRAEQAAWEAQQEAIRRETARQNAIARGRAEAAAAAQRAQQAAIEADKKRNESYEDQLRDLNIQRQKLQLQAEKARADRENEFIDQDLQRRAASTDVVRSEADANRNVSSGVKNYLDQVGQAEIKKQSRP